MSSFLSTLFAQADLPLGVWPSVLATYTPQYTSHIVRNSYLADHLGPLIGDLVDARDKEHLIEMLHYNYDRRVAHLVLLAGEDDSDVLDKILKEWELGPEDALRMARTIDPEAPAAYDVLEYVSPDQWLYKVIATTIVYRKYGLASKASKAALAIYDTEGHFGQGTRRKSGSGSTVRRTRTLPALLPHELTTRAAEQLLHSPLEASPLLRTLTSLLGDATTSDSLHSWMIFFDLANSARNALVVSLAESAAILARTTTLSKDVAARA